MMQGRSIPKALFWVRIWASYQKIYTRLESADLYQKLQLLRYHNSQSLTKAVPPRSPQLSLPPTKHEVHTLTELDDLQLKVRVGG